MPWQPKTSAPAYFSLADAFLALVSGDPDWGWLVDWLTLVPNSGYETAQFCAEGPIFTEPLVVTDFIPTWNPMDPRRAVQTSALAVRIAAAARDRVFGAYCEQPFDAGFGTPVCHTFVAASRGGGAVDLGIIVPAGTSQVRVTFSSFSPSGGGRFVRLWFVPPGGSPGTQFGSFGIGNDTQTPYTTSVGGADGYHMWGYPYGPGDYVADLCLEWYVPGGATAHEPTAQPQPTGVSSPLRPVDPTLEGIASELERLEFKLDTLWPLVQAVAGSTLDLAGAVPEDPVDATSGAAIAVAEAVGAIVTISGVPPQLDVGFGVPQRIVRAGWINIGTADAWYPSVPLTHSPMVIRPFPPGTTRIALTGLPPSVSGAVAMILPNK